MEFRLPLRTLPAVTSVIDGHFRLGDPLPGIYYYAIEEFARRMLRRVKRAAHRPLQVAAS